MTRKQSRRSRPARKLAPTSLRSSTFPPVVIHIHWLDLRFYPKHNGVHHTWLAGAVSGSFPDTICETTGGRDKLWDVVMLDEETRARICAVPQFPARDAAGNERRDVLRLSLPGSWFESHEVSRVSSFLQAVEPDFEVRCQRIDLAFDPCPASIEIIFKEVDSGSCAFRSKLSWAKKKLIQEDGDNTCYLGSRNSGRMVRIYDQRGSTRLELELRKAYAAQAFEGIFQTRTGDVVAAIREKARGMLVDFVDFKRVADQVRPHWWDILVNGASRIRLPSRPRHQTIEKSIETVRRHSRSLARAVLAQARDESDQARVLGELLREGQAKLKISDKQRIAAYRASRPLAGGGGAGAQRTHAGG
jgi:hypothetical protein